MDVLGRYRNLIVLVGVLFVQVLGLAVQVKRTTDGESTHLIRIWAVDAVTPLEKALGWVQTGTGNIWHNYFYLRGVRAENRQLKQEIERMRLEQARMSQDADQARRLQALLAFKEQFISQTMAAQVIGGTGSELSRAVYIDKGSRDGLKPDMAVLTKDGVVGKVLRVYHSTSLVLLINDQTSGVGSILEKSRLNGVVRGTSAGELVLEKVMSDEDVPIGEDVVTSGGDSIFPKGLPVGKVMKVTKGGDLFWNIHVRPASDLSRLEEVLVVTKVDERQAQPDSNAAVRAVDILAERLPSVPQKPSTPVEGTVKNSTTPATGTAKPATSPAPAPGKSTSATSPGTAQAGGATKPNTTVAPNSNTTKVATSNTAAGPVTKKNVLPSSVPPATQGSGAQSPSGAASKTPVKPVTPNTTPDKTPKPKIPPQDTPQ